MNARRVAVSDPTATGCWRGHTGDRRPLLKRGEDEWASLIILPYGSPQATSFRVKRLTLMFDRISFDSFRASDPVWGLCLILFMSSRATLPFPLPRSRLRMAIGEKIEKGLSPVPAPGPCSDLG